MTNFDYDYQEIIINESCINFDQVATPRDKEISLNYKCDICHNLSYNIKTCSKCNKIAGKKCLDNFIMKNSVCTNCSFLKSPYEEMHPLIVATLNSILINCGNAGCKEVLKLDDYFKHLNKVCNFRLFSCKGEACVVKLPKEEMEIHVATCQNIIKTCHHCNDNFTVDKIKIHEFSCGFLKATCEFCNKTFKKKDIPEHKEKCDYRKVMCNICLEVKTFIELEEHKIKCDFIKVRCEDCKTENLYLKDLPPHKNKCCFRKVKCEYCKDTNIFLKDILRHLSICAIESLCGKDKDTSIINKEFTSEELKRNKLNDLIFICKDKNLNPLKNKHQVINIIEKDSRMLRKKRKRREKYAEKSEIALKTYCTKNQISFVNMSKEELVDLCVANHSLFKKNGNNYIKEDEISENFNSEKSE